LALSCGRPNSRLPGTRSYLTHGFIRASGTANPRAQIDGELRTEPVRQGRGLLVCQAVLREVRRSAEQELEPLLAPFYRPEEALVDGAPDDGVENIQP
jgi:hypothetical protein